MNFEDILRIVDMNPKSISDAKALEMSSRFIPEEANRAFVIIDTMIRQNEFNSVNYNDFESRLTAKAEARAYRHAREILLSMFRKDD